ncbi:MAG: DUF4388 domain-containing protein [candidate division Zixibacteria bacterium]|nr:DUF4388 domain-containing protein [candidate division Zixibacteria bacterium]
MKTECSQKRIDEILLLQGKVSETELAAALNRQKAVGGKLCSHLLEYGSVNEADLVAALSEHFGRPGIQLATLEILSGVLDLIPANVALARLILPFAYEPESDCVRIACVDPNDADLLSELNYLLGNKVIELYVAVELSLNRAVNRYYGPRYVNRKGADKTIDQSSEDRDSAIRDARSPARRVSRPVDKKSVLVVTDQASTSQLLKIVLERDGYAVTCSSTPERAVELLRQALFGTVFIQLDRAGGDLDIQRHMRTLSPASRICTFRSIGDLLINDSHPGRVTNRLQQKLELFASLLTINERVPKSQSMRVAYFIDKVCRHLGLTDAQRVMVLSAAHLHEQAKFYYMTVTPRDFRRLTDLVIKLLQSVYYEPAVIDILRSMYLDISLMMDVEAPFEVVGANILTMVDMFAENLQPVQRLTLDRLEEFQAKITPRVGRQLLPEIFDTFMTVAKEESLRTPTALRLGQIMIYTEEAARVMALADRLKTEGFRTITAPSWTSFSRLCRRCRPDLIILFIEEPSRTIFAQVKELKNLGIDIKKTPTLVLAPQNVSGELTPLLEWGVEDILDCECDPDRVALKVSKVWTRIEVSAHSVPGDTQLESRGRLQDMSLIELLQVLGTGGRTTRIQVVPAEGTGDKLEIYLDRGQIVYAQYNDLQGAEAIYVGITWDSGVWTLEPISENLINAHNNQLANEAILLEGCRLLDEMNTGF